MTETRSGGGIVLLLDSDRNTRAVFRDALSDAGYLVATASDLGMAVDRLKEMPPDLLIVRPYINSMAGRLAADYLRTKLPGLPVLIVSGYLDDDRIRNMNEVEMFQVFPQPFGRDQLLAKVREVFGTIPKKSA
jgi:DNA-binding response OmpR family regulator